jgi:2-amino-4-hydroxy-6-hydroxymethyldihydropteridine diphosphokinase
MTVSTAYLSAGSNLGDRAAHLKSAIGGLSSAGIDVMRVSPVYETEPVGHVLQPWFLNIAVCVQTRLAPEALLRRLLDVEVSRGRVRDVPGGPRTLDLDLLLFDDLILDTPALRIPHPRMAQRRFVLVPLAEIAPALVHPQLGMTVLQLRDSCRDDSRVSLHSILEEVNPGT